MKNRWIRPPRRRWGASLTELMTVCTVVTVPTALLGGVAVKVYRMAVDASIAGEIRDLSNACRAFNDCFGEYPPDMHDPKAVKQFLRRAFPKFRPKHYPDFKKFGPASALPLWLGGSDGNGLSANPENPFDTGPKRMEPFMKFKPCRLKKDAKGVLQYFPPMGPKGGSPYVYFRPGYKDHPGWPPARPYRDSNNKDNDWINADSFQILCPGQDGVFGHGIQFPSGRDYDKANLDDIANFSGGVTLQRAKP